MWIFNKDYNKWVITEDQLTKSNFDYLKQELVSTRYYSKCLSGATYLPINNVNNIYDILGEYEQRNWYIDSSGSQYSYTEIPQSASPINAITSNDYYKKYLSEYGLTLKNLFTPDRLIKDSINYLYVDVATTEQINLGIKYTNLIIDGVKLLSGHRLLVKDQISTETLPFDIDPRSFFKSNYTLVQDYGTTIEYNYYNSENGIYLFNDGYLTKTDDLSLYDDCIRYSVSVKLGSINTQRQFHLSRLLSGYYPTSSLNEPVEFIEKHNWLLRNRVDYNNLFEINYYDILKHGSQTYNIDSITYSIPERTISIGEFGVILNTQGGISNIIPNKYKNNLRNITQTDLYYWICGDNGTLLKIRKHDFYLEKININIIKKLKSISFYNNLKGVLVGDLNTILITNDGGLNWDSIIVDDFESYYYNKVIFKSKDKIYIVGNTGVFIELEEDISGWTAYKRRISKFIDDYEEYLLVDNINDIIYSKVYWPISYSNESVEFRIRGIDGTTVIKEILLLVTNDGKIIANDIKSISNFDFIYLEFDSPYGNINNISQIQNSNTFFFTGDDGILKFDITDFKNISIVDGEFNKYSNTIHSNEQAFNYSEIIINKIIDYNSEELLICGNNSLLKSATYSNPLNFNLLDYNFESRLKSKMLFLDYDIASKLNFFTDAGDYRLPTSTSFNITTNKDDIIYSNNNLIDINNNKSGYLKSTINVTDFTNVNPIEIEVKLNLINPVGITNLLINLRAPNGKVINLKRSSSGTGTSLSNVRFTTSLDYNKFMVSNIPYSNKTYQMDKLLQLNNLSFIPKSNTTELSSLLNFNNGFYGKWDLYIQWSKPNEGSFSPTTYYYDDDNNAVGLGNLQIGKFYGWDLSFIYSNPDEIDLDCLLFTPLVYGATAPSFMTQSETNWLSYWKDRQKTFEYYSNTPLDESSKVEISTKFCKSSISSIKNIRSISNSLDSISRLAPSLLDTTQSRFNGLGLTPISSPSDLYDIYFYDYLMIVRTTTNFPVEVGDVISLNSSVVDSQFIVNRIEVMNNWNHLNPILNPVDRISKYIYMYMDFNDNIITELIKSNDSIKITNLNKFQNIVQLEDRFNIHPISKGYELINMSNNITINAKFNNITSYYNLGTQVIASGLQGIDTVTIENKMTYTNSFLKFGYTPNYNILDYLEGLNDITNLSAVKFTPNKEYFAMPHYKAIPVQAYLGASSNGIYFDYNGIGTASNIKSSNILQFGSELKLEWESIFINTFVDIKMYQDNDYYNPTTIYTTNRLLVIKKYYNSTNNTYVIEFGKSIIFPIYTLPKFIDILSRRSLSQISDDLGELNNIHRSKLDNRIIDNSDISDTNYDNNFYNYDRSTNYKISTDSYTKILLSDVDTIKELSAIIYTDYKNELAMNITRLAREYNIKITDTDSYNGKLLIICGDKHDLKNNDGVVIEFNGGTYSSELLNQQYFGYHIVNVIDEYKIYVDIPYINNTIVNDTGYLRYTKSDPFFNYQPIDIIDIGVNNKTKISVELSIDNLKLTNDVYSLVNIDYNKYRFRLIDGLNIETLSLKYPWILEAEISGALLGLNENGLVWYKGYWECGRWFGGTWISGTWISGDWYGGTWNSKRITDNLISVEVDNSISDTIQSTWFGGRWYDGTWNNGTWVDGRWYDGTWNDGNWYKGIWNDGVWNMGVLSGGIWVTGIWNDGIFNCDNDPSYWIDGKWNGGDFENGIWYNGIFEEKNSLARFGTKSYNSRTANWRSGKWLSGSFYSRMITDNNDSSVTSLSHKYSIWKTGTWFTGNWYGGIAYNMNFQSGNWYGGILEDIQIIGISSYYTIDGLLKYYVVLNGEFDFNIGDEINILNTLNIIDSDIINNRYKVIFSESDSINKKTNLYLNITSTNYTTDDNDTDTGLRIISRFRSANWKSGIWTNGIYETGLWEGGIWYNGVFSANWM